MYSCGEKYKAALFSSDVVDDDRDYDDYGDHDDHDCDDLVKD